MSRTRPFQITPGKAFLFSIPKFWGLGHLVAARGLDCEGVLRYAARQRRVVHGLIFCFEHSYVQDAILLDR